jgi:hypothetical protein
MRRTRTIVATGLAAAIALTAIDLRPVAAAPKAPDIRAGQEVGTEVGTTDISARKRRHYRHRHYRGDAATAAAVLGVFGAIAGAAAANSYRRNYYYEPYGYYGPPPGYYYGRPRHYHGW